MNEPQVLQHALRDDAPMKGQVGHKEMALIVANPRGDRVNRGSK
jgi:hypothetical protein